MKPVSYVCPICNGFDKHTVSCPQCGNQLNDEGRVTDFFLKYSPYRPIDDLKMSDGYMDLATHQCPHLVFCEKCNYQGVNLINEIII